MAQWLKQFEKLRRPRARREIRPHQTRDCEIAQLFGQSLKRAVCSGKVSAVYELLNSVAEEFNYNPNQPEYFVTDHFLQECSSQLFEPATKHFKEKFFFVAGYKVGSAFVWNHLVEIQYAQQHAGGALVDMQSCDEALMGLRASGYFLVGHIHSHPGFGRDANMPSATDDTFVRNLASGGSAAVGAVFSRSRDESRAFVRFFADPGLGDFRIHLTGNAVEKLYGNNYAVTRPRHNLATAEFPLSGNDGFIIRRRL